MSTFLTNLRPPRFSFSSSRKVFQIPYPNIPGQVPDSRLIMTTKLVPQRMSGQSDKNRICRQNFPVRRGRMLQGKLRISGFLKG